MPIRLLDANVLITASNRVYPIDMFPEFWDWLAHMAEDGAVKMPVEILEEITDGGPDEDPLKNWVHDNRDAILLGEEIDATLVQRVLDNGYGANLTAVELDQIGRDPFLIACALAVPADRCVVTTEVSAPARQRQNRKIPDVCNTMRVTCCDTITMLRELDFSTGWNR
jgi:hypothetical protein